MEGWSKIDLVLIIVETGRKVDKGYKGSLYYSFYFCMCSKILVIKMREYT